MPNLLGLNRRQDKVGALRRTPLRGDAPYRISIMRAGVQ